VPDLIYVDTSALLDRVLGQESHRAIAAAMRAQAEQGGRLVSSRVTHLEARSIQVREEIAGRSTGSLGVLVSQVIALPVTEEVWDAAHDIAMHVRTLDALHLATCRLIGGVLLASDQQLLIAASALGITIHPASRSA